MIASSNPDSASVRAAQARNPALEVDAPAVAVGAPEAVFLATPFQANEVALRGVAAELTGKILVDCTNPVARVYRTGSKAGNRVPPSCRRWFPARAS